MHNYHSNKNLNKYLNKNNIEDGNLIINNTQYYSIFVT